MSVLQKDFTRKTGIELELVTGSSGKLAAQVENGAPFDIFLSADMEFPARLFARGFGQMPPKTYAFGSLIVCSRSREVNLLNWQAALVSGSIRKIAIANPAIAPYGRAAEETLKYYRLPPAVKSKLVYGESISQVNAYITMSTVPAGFTSAALIHELAGKSKIYWQKIDPKAYGEIRQGAILLKKIKGKENPGAGKFYDYLFSPAAKAIFRNYGYEVR
jgi:molybdate transport system substrate-binding protein